MATRDAGLSEVMHTLFIAECKWDQHEQMLNKHPVNQQAMNALFFGPLAYSFNNGLTNALQ
jgi:hypothetical protein